MSLYIDTGSVKIAGYASVADTVYEHDGEFLRILPGAYDVTSHDIVAVFDHDDRDGRRLGWTRDGSLRVWADGAGLAFEIRMPASHSALGLIRGIKSGVFRACSFRPPDVDAMQADIVVERGQPVRVIKRIVVDEVSVAPAGANPLAACWLLDEPIEQMPHHVRRLRASWTEGRLQAQLAARAARGKASAKLEADRALVARADPFVDRIAAGWRPKGWAHDLEAASRVRSR